MADVTTRRAAPATITVLDLIGGALWTGAIGGTAIAGLALISAGDDDSPFAGPVAGPGVRVIAFAVPAALTVLIAWRLLAATGHARPAPADRWVVRAALTGIVLIAIGHTDPSAVDLRNLPAGVALALFFGIMYGLVPAAAAIVILAPVVLAARTTRLPLSGPAVQVLVTLVAMVVTAVFAVLVAGDLNSSGLTAMAVALAGIGAVLTTPDENRS